MEQVSQRYAEALFELANELHVTDDWQEQMRAVKNVFTENTEFLKVLCHYRVSKEEKKDLIIKTFDGKIDKNIVNFFQLLVDKRRISNIIGIATAFNTLCNDAKNIKEGYVYSVNMLNKDEITSIENAVSKKLDCKVELQNRINQDLISGVKVVVGDVVLDGSMRNRLDSLTSELLKKAGD